MFAMFEFFLIDSSLNHNSIPRPSATILEPPSIFESDANCTQIVKTIRPFRVFLYPRCRFRVNPFPLDLSSISALWRPSFYFPFRP